MTMDVTAETEPNIEGVMLPQALTQQEIADYLKITPRAVRRAIAEGRFPRPDFHIAQCRPRWLQKTIETWMKEGGAVRRSPNVKVS